jgi:hypothetical protein
MALQLLLLGAMRSEEVTEFVEAAVFPPCDWDDLADEEKGR